MDKSGRSTYRTRQKDELAKFLASVKGHHLTVADVCGLLKRRHKNVGATTVYRQLEKMVAEGTVIKYVTDLTTPACFEYIGAEDCHTPVCYHCKCEKCGKLIHVECDEIAATEEHMRLHHDFVVNPRRTVFYGLCGACAAQQ